MPYVSDAQRRFFHTDTARKAGITSADVKHWDEASKGKKLPEHVKKESSLRAVFDAVGKYAGFHDAAAQEAFLQDKIAVIASSNALQTFTNSMKPVKGGLNAPKGLTTSMGLGQNMNPIKGMPGTGFGPKANPLAEPMAARGGAFDVLQQGAMASPADKMKDGATLPARV